MSLKDRIAEDLKQAIRGRDEATKTAIRMLTWAIKNAEVESGHPLEDDAVMALIAKEARRCKESIEGFKKGSREDLAAKEEAELKVLQAYLPPALSRQEIEDAARKVIAEVGASGPADKGKVMSVLIPQLAGRAEGREVNEVVSEFLAALS